MRKKQKVRIAAIIAVAAATWILLAACGEDSSSGSGGKAEPSVNWPSGLTATVGDALSSITLPDNGGGTAGAFAWATPDGLVGSAGLQPHGVTFTPSDTAAYNAKTQNVHVRVCPEGMAWIEAGTFTMGSPEDEPNRSTTENREAQHQVTLTSGFYMGKYLVTQEQYEAVIGTNPSYFEGVNLPVEQVSWYDAVEFCNALSAEEGLAPYYNVDKTQEDPDNTSSSDTLKWLVTVNSAANGYRLPTEAQWEYACRAGTTAVFNTGDNITTDQANYNGNYPYNGNPEGEYRETTTEVGLFEPNAWGLYDMHGNVFEWCWDWYAVYEPEEQTDPSGAVSGAYRVFRGGSWYDSGRLLRSAYRDVTGPSLRGSALGFRLVRP